MKFQVTTQYPKNLDAIAVVLDQQKKRLNQDGQLLDKQLTGALTKEINRQKLSGKKNETTAIHLTDGPAKYVIVLGIGKPPFAADLYRSGTAAIVAMVRSLKLKTFTIGVSGPMTEAATHAGVEGALLGDYRFDRYRAASKPDELTCFILARRPEYPTVKKALRKGQAEAEAAILARHLVNEPPSELTPRSLAREARTIARKNGLRVSVLGPREIERAGLRGLLAVSKGSDEPAQLIKLQYSPPRAKKHIVLIGKGITYDAGGINLKPSRGGMLEAMKMDMAGAAAVIAAISAAKKLGIKAKVTAYVGATENLLGGSAYKPGDVVRTYNGKTIEIGNTDAEGRVTLADILAYAADKEKPDVMIDLATVTDTTMSLGPDYAALFGNDEQLLKALEAAADESGEGLWRLPMPESYDEMTKSKVADFSNIVQSRAYTLSVPLLLKHFVGKTKWAHLDIGGPAWAEKDQGHLKTGGTGFGTRLLLHYLLSA